MCGSLSQLSNRGWSGDIIANELCVLASSSSTGTGITFRLLVLRMMYPPACKSHLPSTPRMLCRLSSAWSLFEEGACFTDHLHLVHATFSVLGCHLDGVHRLGPVVDVQLKSSVPAWRIPTPVRVAQSIRAGHVTVEVQHLLGGGIFRSVAMQGTQGLRRGDPAELLPGLGSAVCLTAFSLVGFIGGIVHGYTRRVHDPRLRWHKNLLTLVTHQTGKLIGIRR